MKRKKVLTVVSAVVAGVIVLAMLLGAAAVPLRYGSFRAFWYEIHGGPVQYPCVLVHGLGGFGEQDDDDLLSYWGASSGSLPQYLRGKGYKVCVPTVGPFSSTWDRTCELYAQLTGTTVDYGEVHARTHHHARYGRTYDTALVPNWGDKENGGQRIRINLIAHSFGGATVRMLASLMAYGDSAEQAATGALTSPLFTGGKADWIFSVTTLAAPHNGSQLTCIVDDLGSLAGVDNMTDLAVDLLFKAVKQYGDTGAFNDLMLDQFGIGTVAGGEEDVSDAIRSLESVGDDHGFYDLSPDGAAALNKRIRTVESVYYFSYAYSTTKQGKLLRGMVPQTTTLPVLYPLALAIGSYTGTTAGGITIDERWQDNDGLVGVVSAQFPTGEAHADLPDDVSQIKPGVWHVAPTRSGDHASAVGMNVPADEVHAFFESILNRVEALR